MPGIQTSNGKAFEYAVLTNFFEVLTNEGFNVTLNPSPAFRTAENKFNSLSHEVKLTMRRAALASIETIRGFEPNLKYGDEEIRLSILEDNKGTAGDVSDIVIEKLSLNWRIGISCKHNHAALKHSRLSPTIDFGKSWLGYSCSDNYWNVVRPQFNYFSSLISDLPKDRRPTWSSIAATPQEKAELIYIPILNAFSDELIRLADLYPDVPSKLVEYLLGRKDFYKVIANEREKRTTIQAFNIHDSLSQNYGPHKASPRALSLSRKLPTKIFDISLKPNGNTIKVTMDEGWALSLRLHNASSKIEPSLKFDIQLIGSPSSLTSISTYW